MIKWILLYLVKLCETFYSYYFNFLVLKYSHFVKEIYSCIFLKINKTPFSDFCDFSTWSSMYTHAKKINMRFAYLVILMQKESFYKTHSPRFFSWRHCLMDDHVLGEIISTRPRASATEPSDTHRLRKLRK